MALEAEQQPADQRTQSLGLAVALLELRRQQLVEQRRIRRAGEGQRDVVARGAAAHPERQSGLLVGVLDEAVIGKHVDAVGEG